MRLSTLKRSPLFAILEQKKAIKFASGSNTLVFSIWDGAIPSLFLFSKDPCKYEYYKYAIDHKYQHIPKIYALMHDEVNDIYMIHREFCNPISNYKKIYRMEKIKDEVANFEPTDKVAKEILDFDRYSGKEFCFDFGTHWLMQTDKGKMVVADAFLNRGSNG